jgi:hypothetical protein
MDIAQSFSPFNMEFRMVSDPFFINSLYHAKR